MIHKTFYRGNLAARPAYLNKTKSLSIWLCREFDSTLVYKEEIGKKDDTASKVNSANLNETRERKGLDKHAGSFAATFYEPIDLLPRRNLVSIHRHRRQIVSAGSMDNGSNCAASALVRRQLAEVSPARSFYAAERNAGSFSTSGG